jgi:hypothetical protein
MCSLIPFIKPAREESNHRFSITVKPKRARSISLPSSATIVEATIANVHPRDDQLVIPENRTLIARIQNHFAYETSSRVNLAQIQLSSIKVKGATPTARSATIYELAIITT